MIMDCIYFNRVKPKLTIFLIFCFSFLFCQEPELELEDGIYFEKLMKNDTSRHRYSKDNITYKPGKAFIYDYYYLDNSGNKKRLLRNDNEYSKTNPLHLADPDNENDSVIYNIKIEVNDYIDMFSKFDSSYTQTVFCYNYLNKKGKTIDTICESFNKRNKLSSDFPCGDEFTGVIDNRMNLWIHPPRSYTFKILEFSPFPFQYLDESVKEWKWSLDVGGPHNMDHRWIHYDDAIHISYRYTRAKDETLRTKLGKIRCKVTESTGTSEFGTNMMRTQLKSYYHPYYGFVKLDYTNINGSKIVMELIEAHDQAFGR